MTDAEAAQVLLAVLDVEEAWDDDLVGDWVEALVRRLQAMDWESAALVADEMAGTATAFRDAVVGARLGIASGQ